MDIGIYNSLMVLIAIFNKDISISDLAPSDNFYEFLKNNSNYIFDTFAYIEYYEELLNKLNKKIFIDDSDNNTYLLTPDIIELMLYYDEGEMQYLLLNQRNLLSKYFCIIRLMLASLLNKNASYNELIYDLKMLLKYDYGLNDRRVKVKKLVKY